jgi:hypothetical protein
MPKVVKYRMGGLVMALDPTARKITIKQNKAYRERKVILTVSRKAAEGQRKEEIECQENHQYGWSF